MFKIERGPAGEKIAYVRLFAGMPAIRDTDRIRGEEHKVTAIKVFEEGRPFNDPRSVAGRIAKVWGLGGARIGDELGIPRRTLAHQFGPPTLETVVVPRELPRKAPCTPPSSSSPNRTR